ncbi:MAG TPA: serine/threonine-protein kinase, partial [Opitutaceae bacterium]
MNATRHGEEELFDQARELEDSERRRAFLDRACRGDPALRARIDELLEAEAEAEQFFAEGSIAMSLPGSAPSASASWSSSTASGEAAATHDEESVGTRIGRYKLVQKIGEGGCGVVYLAEQEEPVRRRVALKIIKLGMETKSVIARFEAERQALAMMDHPNIARVFDAGATDNGSPYFVMELVRGVRITKYCDKNRLNIRQRLDLFIQICHAIQHAHQKGIIHRDIKPSNIMVALHDGVPVPKVIDFGISKATDARLADRLSFTAYAQLI